MGPKCVQFARSLKFTKGNEQSVVRKISNSSEQRTFMGVAVGKPVHTGVAVVGFVHVAWVPSYLTTRFRAQWAYTGTSTLTAYLAPTQT